MQRTDHLVAPTSRPYRARTATAVLFLASGVVTGAWACALPVLQQRLALSNGDLSLALLAFAGGAVSAMSVAGRLAGRYGADRTALAASATFGSALLLPALVSSASELACAALLLGLTNGILDVSMTAHASEVEGRWGSAIMSSFHGSFSLGTMVGAALMSMSLGFGWRLGASLSVFSVAALSLTAVALSLGLRKGLSLPRMETANVGWRLPSRDVGMIAGLAFLSLLIEGAMADWSGVFMTEVAHVPANRSGLAYTGFAACMVMGRLFGDRLVRRVDARRLLGTGGLVVSGAVAVAVAAPSPMLVCLCLAICGLGMSNVVPVLFSAAAETTPHHPADGVAAATMGGYSGFLIGPPLIGFGADLVGLRLSILVLAAAGLFLWSCVGRALTRRDDGF